MKIINFLKALCPVGKVEFNDLSHVLTFDQAMNSETNIYFLASVKDNKKRNSDKDIIHKNYFFIDFDLRKNGQDLHGTIASDSELELGLEILKEELIKHGYGDWRYIVDTGNGYHFYYVGNGKNFGVEEYKLAIEYYYRELESKLNNELFKIDMACKNIGRIARLPGTKNYGRQTKFGLEPKTCEIVEETDVVSKKIEEIPNIYLKMKSEDHEQQARQEIKRQMLSINDDTLEHILEIDIIPLVEEYTGLALGKDGKNFPDKEGNTGMFTTDNLLIHTGTGRISDKHKGYNTFTFVREHYCNGNNNDTFQRFKDRYSHINDLSKKQKKEYKQTVKQQQIQQSLQEDIRVEDEDLTVNFGGLRPSFGLQCIDHEFRRFDNNGELAVLFGAPGSGKTEFGFFLAKSNQKIKTVVFCLEIPKKTILSRRALRRFGIYGPDVDSGKVPKDMQDLVNKEISMFEESSKNYLKMISIKQIPTIEQLLAKMEQEADGQTMFIIDNLGKIQGDDNENIRYADITAKLQTFAYNNRHWVILQHHTVKPQTSNKIKSEETIFGGEIFGPYGFRGSQKIYDNATRMIEIYRDYEFGTAKLFQYKHTPTDARGQVEIVFVDGEYKEHTYKAQEKPF